jgi:hypothetical protein
MSKPLCLVTAPVATRSGYGAHSRDICRALIKLDKYDVKIWPVRWGNTPMNALTIGNPNDDIIISRLLDNPNLPFCETFKNMKKKPGLIMKTGGAGFSVLDREDILKKIEAVKETVDGSLPNIYFLHGDFTDDEMNDLYNHPKVKAHVTFTHGEGFGRPLLEASISQKPVIAPNWSGHIDFLSNNLALLLGGELQKVEKGSVPDDFMIEGAQWFGVNYQDASTALKEIYVNYRKYTLNAKKLGIVNKSKFSLDAMTKKFGKILDKYVPEFPKEVELKLPKLKKVSSVKQPKIKLPKLKKA